MTTVVTPGEGLLHAVVEQVWTSLLKNPLVPWSGGWPAGRPGVLAELSVSGDWEGSVRVWCATPAAASLTRTLLRALDHAAVDDEDVADAVGEIGNVVAGSLKGALGGDSSLGLPVVVALDLPARPLASSRTLAVSWLDHPVLVLIDVTP